MRKREALRLAKAFVAREYPTYAHRHLDIALEHDCERQKSWSFGLRADEEDADFTDVKRWSATCTPMVMSKVSTNSRGTMSYTKDGIKVGLREQKLVPWDTARRVRLKSTGEIITRRTLRIAQDHGIIQTRGLALITRKDVGRLLIVDEFQDGRWIDYLEGP